MKASVAIAIALASSKYFLYRSYNILITSAFLSRSLYSSDFIFHKAGSDQYTSIVSRRFLHSLSFFFSVTIMIITRPQLANTEKIDQ